MKNIIIFRTDRLGDYLIHSRPIYELKKKHTESHLILVCSNLNKKILEHAKYIDEIIIFDKNFSFLKKLKVFFKIVKKNYFASFVLDGKNFSYLCNLFIFSNRKFGLLYKSNKKIFNFNFSVYKPYKLYGFFFFNKFAVFTSRKYLKKSENLCQKYLNLFNELNLNLTVADSYVFQSKKNTEFEFQLQKSKFKLNNYILIHFDEKWLDVVDNGHDLINSIKNLSKLTKNKIVLTAYNNSFEYFKNLKNKFPYFNCHENLNFNYTFDSDIFILDNLEIFMFEKFIKHSKINISCHAGFVVQVCGANKGKLIDIINEKDFHWYSCWKPLNTFHEFLFKSTLDGKKLKPQIFLNKAAHIINNL